MEFEIEGLTSIVGPSNIGKSAIWRAISYALHSKRGTDFVRHGKKHARVEIQDEDFHLIWEKGKGHSLYNINGSSESDRKVSEVPDLVLASGYRDILQKSPDGKVKDRISPQFASQMGGNVFLLDKSPGTIGEVLAQLSRLGALMSASRKTDLERKQVSREIKIREKDESRLSEQVHKFEGLKSLSEGLGSLREQRDVLRKKCVRAASVGSLSSSLSNVSGKLRACAGVGAVKLPPSLDPSTANALSKCQSLAPRYRRTLSVSLVLEGVRDVKIPLIGDCLKWREVSLRSKSLAVSASTVSMALPDIPGSPSTGVYSQVVLLSEKLRAMPCISALPFIPSPSEVGQVPLVKAVAGKLSAAKKDLLEATSEKEVLEGRLSEEEKGIRETRDKIYSLGTCPTCERSFG